ncbi:MAG: 1-deoxy-D-xylulose-5-phosphate reductoisomerase, partial [Senegalia sp. (in: firmicutes)]
SVLNSSNEILVELFLKEKIKFYDIPNITEKILDIHENIYNPNIEDVLYSDNWARVKVKELLNI